MLKCLILKYGITLISEIIEVQVELGEPDCQLVNPFQVVENDLKLWPEVTDQRSILISSESILTIIDPKESLISKYKDMIK